MEVLLVTNFCRLPVLSSSVDPHEVLTGAYVGATSTTDGTGATGNKVPTRQSSRPGRGSTNRYADFDTGDGETEIVPDSQEEPQGG